MLVRVLRRVYRAGDANSRWPTASLTLGGAGAAARCRRCSRRARWAWSSCRKLEEGNFWIRATMPTSISLEDGNGYVNRMRRIIDSYPEVETVVSQHGRPDDGTDATGFFNAEFFVPLKPFDTWPAGVDKDKLTEQTDRRAGEQIPRRGFQFLAVHRGQRRGGRLRREGRELGQAVRQRPADAGDAPPTKIKDVMATVPGITDLAVFNSLGQPTVQIDVDRARAARYGLAPGDINATVQAAIGGQAAGNLYEDGSDRNFPIMVRLAPQYRDSLDAIRRITDRRARSDRQRRRCRFRWPMSPTSQLVSGAVLHLSRAAGALHPDQVQRARPRPGQRGAGSAAEGRRSRCMLPGGYRLEWVGEFGNLQEALAAAGNRRADQPRADLHAAVHQFRLAQRHAAGGQRDPDGADRRHLRAVSHRHAVQRLGGDRLRRAVRHRGDGRHHRAVLSTTA